MSRKTSKRKQRKQPTRNQKIDRVELQDAEYVSSFKAKPFKALTNKQRDYMRIIRNTPVTVATGYAGTSKTYVAARMAAQMLKEDTIEKIVLVRPASSKSKSLGFFKGDKEEKMKEWVKPLTDALKDDFSRSYIDYMIKIGRIDFQPMETIKGMSYKHAFILVDEAEDLTFEELEHVLTRVGEGSKMVLSGDIKQTDLKQSGLEHVVNMVRTIGQLSGHIDYVDFSNPEDIVRSEACKQLTLAFDSYKQKRYL